MPTQRDADVPNQRVAEHRVRGYGYGFGVPDVAAVVADGADPRTAGTGTVARLPSGERIRLTVIEHDVPDIPDRQVQPADGFPDLPGSRMITDQPQGRFESVVSARRTRQRACSSSLLSYGAMPELGEGSIRPTRDPPPGRASPAANSRCTTRSFMPAAMRPRSCTRSRAASAQSPTLHLYQGKFGGVLNGVDYNGARSSG